MPSNRLPADDGDTPPKLGEVKRLSWGMFEIVYGPPLCHFSYQGFLENLRELWRCAPFAAQLLCEIYSVARTTVTVHVLAAMLLITTPAFSLYLSAVILGVVEETVLSRTTSGLNVRMLQGLVIVWLFVAVTSTLATRIMASTAFVLKGYLRAHFFPKLVDASLRLDLTDMQSSKAFSSLPGEYGFEWDVPGWMFFHETITRLQNFLTIVVDLLVLAMIIYRRGIHETQVLAFFSLMLPAVMLLKPSSRVGGAGYVFWAKNPNFYYLAALHKIAFSHDFRATLARDGLCSHISREYKRISEELGHLNVETTTIQSEIRVQWYWELLHEVIVDYPLALCAMILPWSDPLSWLVSMVLVQHATKTVQQSIYQLRGTQGPDTLAQVLGGAERLYETIALKSELNKGTVQYPNSRSSKKGMKITFRNVSFQHSSEERTLAVSKVDFEIPAGSLVVVVGSNGSGKSTLLSLLPRLRDPSGGEILIDDQPLASYDLDSVRSAMACLFQDEIMYPLTLRQNMLMGATDGRESDEGILQRAAQLGRAYDLIGKLESKYDTILDPAAVAAQNMQGCGIGHISDAAMRELEAYGPNFRQTQVSGGERQRLAATRLFSRLLERGDQVRLIVCDEATGAVDSCAERDILRNVNEFGAGRTRIFVTHRFGDLVKEADIILVMKDGMLVQQGKHAELMQEAVGGCREYADMYQAQANGFL
ncbi:P-loop containing nucleoside triphosphate hydrolase protein [Mycena sanguinolenta]|nr:P-loop containing nucleoside triphosphate hydrolase protein [Mycena sanguinolenta]